MSAKEQRLLRIHKNDNVLIVVADIHVGDRDTIDGKEVVFHQEIPIGHKVAARSIQTREKVYKCGVPIGSAKSDVAAGEHIHLHNLKSDYIATYTRDDDHASVQ